MIKEERKCIRPECENIFPIGGRGYDKSKRFCSISCAAKVNNIGRFKFKPPKLCAECNKPLVNRDRKYCSYDCQYSLSNRKKQAKLMQNIFSMRPPRTFNTIDIPIELLGHKLRKQRVIAEQSMACNGCRLTEWRGQAITLELEHKDGDRNNHIRENLEALCPNCHSQTPTWRGRNNRKKITDDELKEAILTTSSLRKALVSVGMADKGGNYRRITRLAKELEGSVGFEPTVRNLRSHRG